MNVRKAPLAAVVLAAITMAPPVWAQTDRGAASGVWTGQLAELRRTQATVRFCNLSIDRAAAAGLQRVERGLDQALGITKSERRDARRVAFADVARMAGSIAAPCAPDSPLVISARAALSAVAARLVEQGVLKAAVPSEPGAAPDAVVIPAQPASVGVVPVPDPNISLIQNCRSSVLKRLGSAQAAKNNVFWPHYEMCISKQGVGWF